VSVTVGDMWKEVGCSSSKKRPKVDERMMERDGLYCNAVLGGSSKEKFEAISFTGLLKERKNLEKSVTFPYGEN